MLKMHKTRRYRIALAMLFNVTVLLAGASGSADEIDPVIVVEGRQANLRDLGGAFKNITDELKKSMPTLPVIKLYARQIRDLAEQQRFWFPVGSGPQPDVETDAKPEIWARPEEFAAAQAVFSREAAKFVEVIDTGEVSAIKAQHRTLAKTCSSCHKQFREE